MAVFILALVGQEEEELLKCVLMDTREQSVTMDGIVEMQILCADSWDSTHLELFQEDILTWVEELDWWF